MSARYLAERSVATVSPSLSDSLARAGRTELSAPITVAVPDTRSIVPASAANPSAAKTTIATVANHRTLRLNLAGFVTRYNDMQVSQLLGSGVTLDNAGKATIKGVEAELVLTPVRPLRLSASTGFLDAPLVVPQPLGCAAVDGEAVLLMSWLTISNSHEPRDWAALGEGLARLHRHSLVNADGRFGWHHDNFIGSGPQANGWRRSDRKSTRLNSSHRT